MALTLAIGFVVDDAIVMLENIVRHMEMGKTRLQAAMDGSKEVGFTIVSMTLSLAAVFIPVLFMGGIIGRVFREFAVTIGVAVLVSGFISLTLTPMLSAKLLRPSAMAHHGRAYAVTERGFKAMLDFYGRTLSWVLKRRRSTMVISLIVLIATVFLFMGIPKGFLPSEDRDTIIDLDRSGGRHCVSVHGGASGQDRGHHQKRSEHRGVHVQRRLTRRRCEHGPHDDSAEAAFRAAAQRGSDRPFPAGQTGRRARHPGVCPESACDPDWREIQQEPCTSTLCRAPIPASSIGMQA